MSRFILKMVYDRAIVLTEFTNVTDRRILPRVATHMHSVARQNRKFVIPHIY